MSYQCNGKFSFCLKQNLIIPNQQLPESMKKNKECYEEVNTNGIPFPVSSMDKDQVKKFFCQKNFQEIGKKAEDCAKQPKEELEDEHKKVVACLKKFSSQ